MSKTVRDAAADAAQRRKVTVGAWLSGAIDREINAEREPLDLTPGHLADRSDAETRLALIERTVAAAVSLAGARGVPRAFRQDANQLLRESLPAPLTAVVVSDRRPRLGAPVPKTNGKIEPGGDPAHGHA